MFKPWNSRLKLTDELFSYVDKKAVCRILLSKSNVNSVSHHIELIIIIMLTQDHMDIHLPALIIYKTMNLVIGMYMYNLHVSCT